MNSPIFRDTWIYIGSSASGDGEGIHVGKWNASTGAVEELRLAYACIQPSFPVAESSADGGFLFSGHQPTETRAALSSFRSAQNGDLQLITTVELDDEPESLIQLVLDKNRRVLIAPSYRTSKIRSFMVNADGSLSQPVSEFRLSGSGPDPERQAAAHAHGAVVSPDNKFVLINDLGSDKIMIYRLNQETGHLEPNTPAFYKAEPGSGPRHTAFHPNGRFAYSINELDSTITTFSWNSEAGVLAPIANTPTLPLDGDVTTNRAGEVILDATGSFLYACNRGRVDELLVYAVSEDGKLELQSRTPLEGKEARHFAISPDGNYLVVAEQVSNFVSVFMRDPSTGALTKTANKYPINQASCISFLSK
jgi:6-phosphogluconolactonase